MRKKLPDLFPGVTFSFLPADIVSQILNFGSPAPIDVQINGPNLEANRDFANKMLARMKGVPGLADGRVQQAFKQPTLNVGFDRTMASLVGLNEQSAATSMLQTLAGSSQTNPIYWLNPDNQISYPVSVQTPQFSMDNLGDLRWVPLTATGQTQLLGGLASFDPSASHAVVSALQHPAGHRHLCDAGRPRPRRGRRGCEKNHGPTCSPTCRAARRSFYAGKSRPCSRPISNSSSASALLSC